MKKRTLTLIEIMIVILLISLIGGAIGYNMKGSLEKGKNFKTKQAKEMLYDQLMLCVDEGHTFEQIAASPKYYLDKLGLAKNAESLLKDGWGEKFTITVTTTTQEGKDFKITSPNLPDVK